jgi:hypothetical protein
MSEFNRQLGVARDAFTSSSKSNYGSEEADLTDAIIKNQETIDMPNTRAFFESVKNYEKIKDQGSFLNTMKQVAGVFSAAAQFKKVSDAVDKENDAFELGLGFADKARVDAVDQFNASESKLEIERQEAGRELRDEAETLTGDAKKDTELAELNLIHTDIDGANIRKVANSIGDHFKPIASRKSSEIGLDGISTTGEAYAEIDNKIVKNLYGAALYEALENDIDITNDRIFKRYVKKITPKIFEARDSIREKWAYGQEVALKNFRTAQRNSDIREAVITNDANALFKKGGILDDIRATEFKNQPGSYPLAMQYLEDQIVSDIQKDAFAGGEGTLISPANLANLLDEAPIEITRNGKTEVFNGLINVPDKFISKQLKDRFERRITGALSAVQTEAANELDQRKANLRTSWDKENIYDEIARLRNNPVKLAEFLDESNMVILQAKWISYARNQVDGDGTLLYDVTIDGQPKLTDALNKFLAKADTGKNDVQVNQKAKYQDVINEFHDNDIKSAVKQHLFGDKGKGNNLIGADNQIFRRMKADFDREFLKSLPILERKLSTLGPNDNEEYTITEHLSSVYNTVKTNLDNNVYDAPLSIGGSVSIPLLNAKKEFVQSYIDDEGLKDATEVTNLAEKNNFERAKGWRDSGGTLNTDIISFYDDVPMFKMVNGKKVPMTSLQKFLYRSRAVNYLTTDESAKIAKWDETMEFYTDDDRIALLNKPTEGKFLQISAESLPTFTAAAKAMKAGPNNTFDSIESPKLVAMRKGKTSRQLSRLPKVKSLQEMTKAELENAVYNLDATNIGYYGFGGFEALDLLQQLGVKDDEKISENLQTAMRMLKAQNNITRRKRAMAGLTVVNSDAAWVEATGFTYDEMQAIKKVFPLLEGYEMTNFDKLQRQVAKVFVTDLEKYGADNLIKAGYRIVTGVPKRQEIDEIVEKERIETEPLQKTQGRRKRTKR